MGAGAAIEGERAARAGSHLDQLAELVAVTLGVARGEHQVDDVRLGRVGDGVDLDPRLEHDLLRDGRRRRRRRRRGRRHPLAAAPAR